MMRGVILYGPPAAGKDTITAHLHAVDPAYAPATGTPEVGGLTSFEALSLVRALAGCALVGADVVEVTDLTEAAVPPARADDVDAGHEVSSLEAARRYVRNLRRDSELLAPSSTTTTTEPVSTTAPPTTATP